MSHDSPHNGRYDGPLASTPRRLNAADLTNALPGGTSLQDFSRADIARNRQSDYGTKRNLYEALGYPQTDEITYEGLFGKYLRDPIARTIVDKPAEDTWQDPPKITDTGDPEDDREETEFEEAVRRLLDGETTRKSLAHRWFVADVLNRLGSYSVLFFSFADGARELTTGVLDSEGNPPDDTADADDTVFSGSVDERLDKLWHVQVYSESRATVAETEEDFRDRRYGLPVTYELEPDDDSEEEAHWSRVIHVAEGTLTDDLTGQSVLLPIFNRLEDLERLLGGSSEMFWQGAFPGMVVSPPILRGPDGEESFADFEDEGEDTEKQIQKYRQTLERAMFTEAEVQQLDPNIASPSDQVDVQMMEISAGSSPTIPQNMLTGNELGDRATTEDRKTYHESIRSRRHNFAEPQIVRPTIDRLIDVGILPQPVGGEYGYEVEWKPLEEPGAQEQAEVHATEAAAAKDMADALAVDPSIRDELHDRLDYDVDDGDGSMNPDTGMDPGDALAERTNGDMPLAAGGGTDGDDDGEDDES